MHLTFWTRDGHKVWISPADTDLTCRFSWSVWAGYVMSKHRGQTVILHRLVAERANESLEEYPLGVVTHRDGNRFNNTRENLVVTSRSAINRSIPNPRNCTGYRGVAVYRQEKQQYIANIQANGRQVHLGVYRDIELAARVRDAAARHFHGEGALLNFPDLVDDEAEALLDFHLDSLPKRRRHASSRFYGVSWDKRKQRWRARLQYRRSNGHLERVSLGSYACEEQAAQVVDTYIRDHRLPLPRNLSSS